MHRDFTSGMANSNGYFPDVGGATLGLYQDNTSTATSKQLLPSAPLLSNLGGGGGDSYLSRKDNLGPQVLSFTKRFSNRD